MTDITPWLQWPLLAAFLAVIFFVGKYFVDRAQKDAEHARAQEAKGAEFIRQLAQDGIAAYKAHAEATREQSEKLVAVLQDNTRAWNQDAEALFALTRAVEQRNRQEAEQHAELASRIDRIVAVTEH